MRWLIRPSVNRMTPIKTWFITGAAAGLGREWAEAALERGDAVVATAREPDRLAPLVERFGDRVLALALDVTDRDRAFAAVREGAERFGSLDIVINNAGYGHFGMVEELTEDEIRAQLETNLLGALWVTQAALPIMRAQGSGHLIQVSSEGGVIAYPGIGAYHASKWALEGLTQSLAQEVAALGLSVTLVEPGPYGTGWLDAGSRSAENPAYAHVRAGTGGDWEIGDPRATRAAMLAVVDADAPPLRVFFGRSLGHVSEAYASRLAQWRAWEPVAQAAFG
jgi:NAD(P)-dependent dehydrogenase (short-subunit alcohol dehydrogenase family)